MAMVLKTIVTATSPWVRIPRPPLTCGNVSGHPWLARPDGRRTDTSGHDPDRGGPSCRAREVYMVTSPGVMIWSSMARASRASLLGAGLPVAAYFIRARLMYWRTVFSVMDMRRPTEALDMPWNHSSSACRSWADSAGPDGWVS